MSGRLAGKVALITGTAGGQGRAAALLFAAEGATVVGTDLNAEGAAETVALVHAAGGRMDSRHPLDLGDEAAVMAWVDDVARDHGGIDIVHNNAAAATPSCPAPAEPRERKRLCSSTSPATTSGTWASSRP